MNAYDMFELTRDIERRLDVNELRYDGIAVWPIVKIQLLAQIGELRKRRYAKSTGLSSHSIPSDMLATEALSEDQKTQWRLRYVDRTLMMLDSAEAPLEIDLDVLAFHLVQDYRSVVDGALHDDYIDPIAAAFGGRWRFGHILIGPDFAQRQSYCHPPALLTYEGHGGLTGELPHILDLSRGVRAVLDEVKANNRWINLSVHDVVKRVIRIHLRAQALQGLLIRLAPRAVMLQSFANLDKQAVVLAANRVGIPTIDVQHGFIEAASVYVPSTKARAGEELLYPAHLFCWGQETASRFAELLQGNAWSPGIHVIGFPGDLTRADAVTTPAAPAFSRPAHARRVALFIHQPDLTLHNKEGEIVPRHVAAAMGASRGDIHWLIRLHPRSRHLAPALDKQLRLAGLGNVEITWPSHAPLKDVLDAADIVLTSWSTIAFEANRADKQVVIIDEVGVSFFRNYLNENLFQLGLDTGSLLAVVRSGTCGAAGYIPYFAEDALAQTQGALESVLSTSAATRLN
jgi:hypothetical protein